MGDFNALEWILGLEKVGESPLGVKTMNDKRKANVDLIMKSCFNGGNFLFNNHHYIYKPP